MLAEPTMKIKRWQVELFNNLQTGFGDNVVVFGVHDAARSDVPISGF